MRIICQAIALLIASCIAAVPVAIAESSDFDPETGLRIHHYTDPVPDEVPGGTVVDTAGVKRLIDAGRVILIDVLSISGVRYDELDGSWSDYEPRYNIPGSIWLPNVGYGKPSADMLKYFLDAVGEATDGDKGYPVLIYCVSDCWMGWNAVQHLARAGYTSVFWAPRGTDGWVEAGYELELTEPTPVNVDS
jgi:PQQ-dependent catabolism-associated CXXCW motif protein